MVSLHVQTLVRAAQIAGGVDNLAVKFKVPPKTLSAFLRGKLPVPPSIFLKATDILAEAGVADVAVKARPDSKHRARDQK
jgi:hypothetical protein